MKDGIVTHGLITCDICGEINADTRRFTVPGAIDDLAFESIDLCKRHQWVAYQIAEEKCGPELGQYVYATLQKGKEIWAERRAERRAGKINCLGSPVPLPPEELKQELKDA